MPTQDDRRKYPRIETVIPIQFNLNPDYHFVPAIRKRGVAGTTQNISLEGLLIGARMDMLDICQVFPEALDDDSPFELEVVLTDFRGRRERIMGTVKWYLISEAKGDIHHFQAGLYLRDAGSRAIARSLVDHTTVMN
jgi:hypothetical protein